MSVQPGRQHFDFATYTDKARWNSYWHQIDEVSRTRAESCLVVGPGDGIVSSILRHQGVNVTTLDVVPDLEPDVLGDVRDLPMEAGSFDVAMCCQVLEHIPYDDFSKAIRELARVARSKVIISLPDQTRSVDLSARVAAKHVFKRISLPSRKDFSYNGVHYWELGTVSTPTEQAIFDLCLVFDLERSYLVRENVYHRFFVLSVRS